MKAFLTEVVDSSIRDHGVSHRRPLSQSVAFSQRFDLHHVVCIIRTAR